MEKLRSRLYGVVHMEIYDGLYSEDEAKDQKIVSKIHGITETILDQVVDEVKEYQTSLLDSLNIMYDCLKEYPVPTGETDADISYEKSWRKKWERAWKMVNKVKKEVTNV